MEFELKMPRLGESIKEATILAWLKNEGDRIEEDEMVLEVATDKVDSEVPSTVSGVLKSILFAANDVVEVGKTIAIIEMDDSTSSAKNTTEKPETTQKKKTTSFVKKK